MRNALELALVADRAGGHLINGMGFSIEQASYFLVLLRASGFASLLDRVHILQNYLNV